MTDPISNTNAHLAGTAPMGGPDEDGPSDDGWAWTGPTDPNDNPAFIDQSNVPSDFGRSSNSTFAGVHY